MIRTPFSSLAPAAAALVLALAGGCDRNGPSTSGGGPAASDVSGAPTPPVQGDGSGATNAATPSASTRKPTDEKVAEFLGLRGPKPVTWTWQPPEGSMRAANWAVPGSGGGDQAHVVVFKGIGGGRDANIARWVAQFRTAEQRAVEPRLETFAVDDLSITLVELSGEWMKMGEQWFTEGQLFLGAVIESPGQPEIYVRFAGDASTVEANREAFMSMLHGLKRIPS